MSARDSWMRKSGFVIGVSAMTLTLLVSAFAMVLGSNAAQSKQRQVITTHTALFTVDDLHVVVTEAEVAVDDYVMSDGVTGASLYQEAQSRVIADSLRLTAPQGVGGSVQRDIAQVQRLAPAFLGDLQGVIALEQAGQTAAAMRRLSVGAVEQDAQALRGTINGIQAAENSLLRSQVTAAEEAQRFVTTIIVISALLDIGTFVAIVLVLRRTATLREQFAEERVRAEEQARVRALEDVNRRMRDFVGIASHEIRTPLTSLKIGLQLTTRVIRRLTEEARSRGVSAGLDSARAPLDRAIAATDQLERLVADLVDATRIQAGALSLRQAAFDLEPLIADCVAEQRLYHPERVITLSAPDSAIIVLADADRIRQVAINYLVNALKFSDERRPVRIMLSADAGEAMVRVRDEGQGIPPEGLDRIWDQFYREPGATHMSGSSEGFGLGLYICKSIIEQHGGKVGVESVVGRGATFWFTLPLAAPDAWPASSTESEGATEDATHQRAAD